MIMYLQYSSNEYIQRLKPIDEIFLSLLVRLNVSLESIDLLKTTRINMNIENR